MPGQIKKIIDTIVEKKANGNPTLMMTTRTKLILKGIDPEKFDAASPDDPALISKLKGIAQEMGLSV